MIINPIVCENCGRELQPDDIMVGIESDNLVRLCGFCGSKVKIREVLR